MILTIQKTNLSQRKHICHQILGEVFHQELGLVAMKIPDRYDSFSVYAEILDGKEIVGTYRIILPNSDAGFPIEEIDFDTKQFSPQNICEMSRLALVKEKRGQVPFKKIIDSACQMALEHGASVIIVALLPWNVPLFARQGFVKIGPPLFDASVQSINGENSVIVPMYKNI